MEKRIDRNHFEISFFNNTEKKLKRILSNPSREVILPRMLSYTQEEYYFRNFLLSYILEELFVTESASRYYNTHKLGPYTVPNQDQVDHNNDEQIQRNAERLSGVLQSHYQDLVDTLIKNN